MNEVENAIRLIQEARADLLALYLPDPADEVAAAETPVPVFLAEPMRKLRAAQEHLMNARDFATV